VLEALPERDDVSYIGLVLNRRGMERAAATKVDEINAVVAATEEFAHRNQGMSLDDTITTAADVVAAAREAGLASSVTVSTAFGCPYEFEVPVDALAEVARRVADAGPDEIALADTIGVAVPTDVRARIDAVRAAIDPAVRLRVHFHNTRNTGLANVAAAVEVGIGVVDASLGGIGGCPFAPNATGNVPTEDVVYLLERMGHRTGVDLDALLSEVAWLEATLDRAVPGLMAKAGTFPN
jgi:hydroxymethylglutaryl-CoA lyase